MRGGGGGKGGAGLSQSRAGCLFKRWRGARRGLFICRECWLPAPRRRKGIQRNKAGPPGEAPGRGRAGHGPARSPRQPLEAGPPSCRLGPRPWRPAGTPPGDSPWCGRPGVGTRRRLGGGGSPPSPASGCPTGRGSACGGLPGAGGTPPGRGAGQRVTLLPGTETAARPRGRGRTSRGVPAQHRRDPGVGGCPWRPARPWPPLRAGRGERRGGRRGKDCLCSPVPSARRAPRQPRRGPITQPAPAPPRPAHRRPGTERGQHPGAGGRLLAPQALLNAPRGPQWPGASGDNQPHSDGCPRAAGAAASGAPAGTRCGFRRGALGRRRSPRSPGQRRGAGGRAAPRRGPRSPSLTPFPPVPGRSWTRPGASWNPSPRSSTAENTATGPGPNPSHEEPPAQAGGGPRERTDTQTRRSEPFPGPAAAWRGVPRLPKPPTIPNWGMKPTLHPQIGQAAPPPPPREPS